MSTGLALPVKGIRLIQDKIRISSNSYLGPVLSIPIQHVPVVGALITSHLFFGVQSAATVTPVKFAMTPALQLGCSPQQLESQQCVQDVSGIQIQMPNFNSKVSGPFPDCGGLDDCSWNQATSTLSLVTTKYFEAKTELRVTIPASGKIVLPDSGVLANDAQFTVSVLSHWGDLWPTSIQETMGLGSFQQTAIRFTRGAIPAAANVTALNRDRVCVCLHQTPTRG